MNKEEKRFVKKFLVFGAIFIALLLIMNVGYYHLILSSGTLEKKYTQFQECKKNIKILVLGDSHTDAGINPMHINNSFNDASAGESYFQTYYKLKTYLDEGLKLEVIILPFDLHSFSSFRADRIKQQWYWSRYVNYLELSKNNKNIKVLDTLNLELQSFFPVINKGQHITELFFMKSKKNDIIKGYEARNGNYSKLKNKYHWALSRVNSQLKNQVFIDESLVKYFKKILELSEENNISVVLIKYPLSIEYFTAIKEFIPDTEKYYQDIKKMIMGYKDIFLLDYQKLFFGQDSLFSDSDHLNNIGAIIFTKQVNNDLNRLGLTE